jgi:hypothetical protein
METFRHILQWAFPILLLGGLIKGSFFYKSKDSWNTTVVNTSCRVVLGMATLLTMWLWAAMWLYN